MDHAARVINKFKTKSGSGWHEQERYLLDCLEACNDLSSNSIELQEKIRDRHSEYQLSPARANLIRGLNLGSMKNVLELGCGCGPITRYLGESGMTVHAVEPCPAKSALARMRCRDLENVQIINIEYPDLALPASRYDIIFMIGTLNQLSFSSPDKKKSQEFLKTFIRTVKKSLKDGGILAAAVDNRTGLKFRSTTWKRKYRNLCLTHDICQKSVFSRNRDEWKKILQVRSDETCAIVYPFPDYTLPRVLLADDFISSDEHSYSLLYRVLSKDQHLDWQADDDEFFRWKALHESGCLSEFTNSFLMLISTRAQAIEGIAPYDFIHFSSEIRRPRYRASTFKLHGDERVAKKLLYPAAQTAEDNEQNVRLMELDSSYVRGPLVTTLWLEAFSDEDFENRFTGLLREYFLFVLRQAESLSDNSSLIDLLPSNLVAVASQNQYKAIDQEWRYTEPFFVEFILFRAFLWFGYHNRCSLSGQHCATSWRTVKDFVEYCFARLEIAWGTKLDEFATLEDNFHAQIAVKGFPFSTRVLLMTPLPSESTSEVLAGCR